MSTTTTAPAATIRRSLLTLDAHHPRVRKAVADAHHMHTLVMSGFTGLLPSGTPQVRAALGVLYAVRANTNSTLSLMVQSHHEPDWNRVVDGAFTDLTEWDEPTRMDVGWTRHFQLRAVPTVSQAAARREDGSLPRGRKKVLRDPEAQARWLTRQGQQRGFSVETVTVVEGGVIDSETKSQPRPQRRTPDARLTMPTALFTGQLTITDTDLFAATLHNGIGAGKSYGCGLLLTRGI